MGVAFRPVANCLVILGGKLFETDVMNASTGGASTRNCLIGCWRGRRAVVKNTPLWCQKQLEYKEIDSDHRATRARCLVDTVSIVGGRDHLYVAYNESVTLARQLNAGLVTAGVIS